MIEPSGALMSCVMVSISFSRAFWGAFVSQLIRADKRLEEFSIDELAEYARYGNAVASLCVEKRGGLRSIPEESEAMERLTLK